MAQPPSPNHHFFLYLLNSDPTQLKFFVSLWKIYSNYCIICSNDKILKLRLLLLDLFDIIKLSTSRSSTSSNPFSSNWYLHFTSVNSNVKDWARNRGSGFTSKDAYFKAILLLLTLFIDKTWLFSMWISQLDPQLRLSLNIFELHSTDSFFIWMLSAGDWIRESLKMAREEFIRSSKLMDQIISIVTATIFMWSRRSISIFPSKWTVLQPVFESILVAE